MLRSNLCDYSDAYIILKRRRSVPGTNSASRKEKKLIFKNKASLRSYISKNNNAFVDNAEILILSCRFIIC